ncbi:MAGE family-domain-containing protein [Phascolomyces articulosus]|uniref:MAGE family-domain-containing protein n=1 Tax=Phascolomyces articulosus TaxID=60185 RepID=A0AAD5KBA8_9FUNG|nr:MAGE family-domain-containing protein [Phascolomyces articulosus]
MVYLVTRFVISVGGLTSRVLLNGHSSQKRARRIRDDNDDEYRVASSSSQRHVNADPGSTNWDDEVFQRKIRDTVRYALACECKRQPIRRVEINKKILQERSYEFNEVQQEANRILKHLFGFEMIELKPKERSSLDSNKGKAPAKASTAAKAYIICSTLDNKYRTPELIHRSEEEY